MDLSKNMGSVENMDSSIQGRFYPPQSSDGCEGTLWVRDEQVFASVFNEGKEAFARDKLRIEPRIGKMPRKIYLPNGFVFETQDSQSVDAIDRKSRWKLLARLEQTGWHLIPFAILTPILAIAFYRLMIPLIISVGLFMTPEGLPHRIDKASLASLDRIWMHPTEVAPTRQDELTQIFNAMLEARPEERARRKPEYNLQFRKMRPALPNAFALPGGTVVLTDSLVRDFGDDDLLAGIMAHEIAHVEYEHSLRQIYRVMGMAVLINMIAGDAGPMLEDILFEGSALISLSFSRKHEIQADSYSVPMMEATGRRPDAIIDFFEALERGEMKLPDPAVDAEIAKSNTEKANDDKTKAAQSWFSSHPLHQDRIDNIKRLTQQDASPNE